jgi:hypothetical protein
MGRGDGRFAPEGDAVQELFGCHVGGGW